MGSFEHPQIIDVANQQRKFPRSLDFSTAGATYEAGEPNHGLATGLSSIWFKLTVPENVAGVLTIGPRVSAAAVAALGLGEFDLVYVQAALYRQEGSGFAGLVYIEDDRVDASPGSPLVGIRVNCEGHLQGRATPWLERGVSGGQVYYWQVQVARYEYSIGYIPVDLSASVEWLFDAPDEPYEFVHDPGLPNCPGPVLTTEGYAIWYYDIVSGWPAWMKPGTKSIPHAPALPAQGHMFAVDEWQEQWNVQVRNIFIGWTEASGPFFYGHLNPAHDYRTLDIDDTEFNSQGAGSPDGQNHSALYVDFDSPHQHEEIRSNVGGLATEPVIGWGSVRDALSLTWTLNLLNTLSFDPWVSGPQVCPRSGTARVLALLQGDSTTETKIRVYKNGSPMTDVTIAAGEFSGVAAEASVLVGDSLTAEVIEQSSAFNLTLTVWILP